ncbi:MAG TPA: hypothetical protein ENI68_01245 [Gammaproteobacteria bacterium]|nr:hypothetical protein [Gammaproteobacteria bacterium]
MLRMLWKALLGRVRLVAVLGAVIALGGVAYMLEMSHDSLSVASGSDQTSVNSTSAKPAWGDAVLANIDRYVVAVLPIRVANACGLGASSCFKCHNGKRAESPSNKPWHTQHEPVNFSCAGCHKGNPRLMMKSIAHSRLIVDPRQTASQSCFNCHTTGDPQKLVDRYLKLSNKKKGE